MMSSYSRVSCRTLRASQGSRVFQAAVVLYRRHTQPRKGKSEYTCSMEAPSHQIGYPERSFCDVCGRTRCQEHALRKDGCHSTDTLLVPPSDYHKYHLRRQADIEEHSPNLSPVPNLLALPRKLRLYAVAVAFPVCRPILYQAIRPGWYDTVLLPDPEVIRIISIPNEVADLLSLSVGVRVREPRGPAGSRRCPAGPPCWSFFLSSFLADLLQSSRF